MRIMILGCLRHRVARAYYSGLGHGTARAHLTLREARFLFVCYTKSLFCAACVARALLRHFYTLKFILVFCFCFVFLGGRNGGRNSSCSFVCTQICRGPYGFALGSRIKLFSVFQNVKTTKY